MAKITIDLTNYKDRVGARVKPGRYRVQVEDVEETTARSGNTMINLFLRVVGGEFDGSNLMDRLVLTEKSMFRVVGFLQAIGYPTPKKRLAIDIEKFVGKFLDVDVDDGEPYQGRVRSEIRGYSRIAKSEEPKEEPADDFEDVSDDFEDGEQVEESGPEPDAEQTENKEDGDGAEDSADVSEEEVDLSEVSL